MSAATKPLRPVGPAFWPAGAAGFPARRTNWGRESPQNRPTGRPALPAPGQEPRPVWPGRRRLPAGLAQRQALRDEIKKGLAQLEADGRQHYHPVEPEARRMKVGQTNRFAYNAQAVADAQADVIVACDVSRQETDGGQLVPMIEQARADLHAAAQADVPVLVPPAVGKPAHDNPYAAQHFRYNATGQTVTCPRGQTLDHEGHTTKEGVRVERYRCHCADCSVRAQCTRDPKGRQFEVWPHTPEVQAMRDLLRQAGPAGQFAQRGRITERRFAQLKQHDGFRRWTVWGLEGVRTQWAMLCATLNLRGLYRRWRQRQEDACRRMALADVPPFLTTVRP